MLGVAAARVRRAEPGRSNDSTASTALPPTLSRAAPSAAPVAWLCGRAQAATMAVAFAPSGIIRNACRSARRALCLPRTRSRGRSTPRPFARRSRAASPACGPTRTCAPARWPTAARARSTRSSRRAGPAARGSWPAPAALHARPPTGFSTPRKGVPPCIEVAQVVGITDRATARPLPSGTDRRAAWANWCERSSARACAAS